MMLTSPCVSATWGMEGIALEKGSKSRKLSDFVGSSPGAEISSKYPPAEPEALRLLAPQRGLIATGESQKQVPPCAEHPGLCAQKREKCALPDLSNFCCLPGRAGDLPTD